MQYNCISNDSHVAHYLLYCTFLFSKHTLGVILHLVLIRKMIFISSLPFNHLYIYTLYQIVILLMSKKNFIFLNHFNFKIIANVSLQILNVLYVYHFRSSCCFTSKPDKFLFPMKHYQNCLCCTCLRR